MATTHDNDNDNDNDNDENMDFHDDNVDMSMDMSVSTPTKPASTATATRTRMTRSAQKKANHATAASTPTPTPTTPTSTRRSTRSSTIGSAQKKTSTASVSTPTSRRLARSAQKRAAAAVTGVGSTGTPTRASTRSSSASTPTSVSASTRTTRASASKKKRSSGSTPTRTSTRTAKAAVADNAKSNSKEPTKASAAASAANTNHKINKTHKEVQDIQGMLDKVRLHIQSEIPPEFRLTNEGDNKDDEAQQQQQQQQQALLLQKGEAIRQRFELAKQQYLQARFEELVLDALEKRFDKTTGKFKVSAPVHTQAAEEEERLKEQERQQENEALVERAKQATRGAMQQHDALRTQAIQLQQGLKNAEDELADLQGTLATSVAQNDNDEMDDNDNDETITDAMWEAQQREHQKILLEKAEAQANLKKMELQVSHETAKQEHLLQRINSIRLPPRSKSDGNGDGTMEEDQNDADHEDDTILKGIDNEEEKETLRETFNKIVSPDTNLEEYEQELRAQLEMIQAKKTEQVELAEWYDSLRESLEHLGGIRVLSTVDTTGNNSDNNMDGGLVITLELLQKHVLELTLTPPSGKKNQSEEEETEQDEPQPLKLTHARLIDGPDLILTGTPDDCLSNGVHTKPVQLVVPTTLPQDLLEVAQNELLLENREDLKFVVHETLMRLTAFAKKVEELQKLRSKYLTQIDKNGNEVVCSLNEGVTVILSLSCDCPLLRGSVSINEIVGLPGWNK